jgi:hypothetical protein
MSDSTLGVPEGTFHVGIDEHAENYFFSKTNYFVLKQTAPCVIILDVQVFKVTKILDKLLTNCLIVSVNLWSTCIRSLYWWFIRWLIKNVQPATATCFQWKSNLIIKMKGESNWMQTLGPNIFLIEIFETQTATLWQVEGRRHESPCEEHLCRFSVECLCVVDPVPINVCLRSGTRTADVDEIGAVCGHGTTVPAVHVRVVIVRWAISATCLSDVVDSCAKVGNHQRPKEYVSNQARLLTSIAIKVKKRNT